ncbi:MAG: sulfurtransferase [Legionellales bacterium]|nr:sulfurtransferase [Legionellales bacterium]|tara:strand:- start:377 stop:694 length:318 start_codon:yes stop_codon:yes gene_type:complete
MEIQTVDPATLKQWLENEEAILIDVRSTEEFAEGHIPGAVNLPLEMCVPHALPEAENKKLVFQCLKGKRSVTACEQCRQGLNVPFAWTLEGGIAAWESAGFEVKK